MGEKWCHAGGAESSFSTGLLIESSRANVIIQVVRTPGLVLFLEGCSASKV